MEQNAERMFVIKKITISRGWETKPTYNAELSIANNYSDEITIKIPEEKILPFLDLAGDLITAALSSQLMGMREDVQHMLEQRKQEALPAPIEPAPEVEDDDIPF